MNLTSPLVSVIVPVYNAKKTIRETIDSILAQTYLDFELVIIDDGSTDNTAKIITEFSDRRIRYFSQPHSERSIARNNGIANSNGSIIAFIDADDLWMPEKLEKQIALLKEKPELGLVYSDLYHIDGVSGKNIFLYSHQVKLHRGRVSLRSLLEENFIQSPTPVVRKEVFQCIGLFDSDVIPVEDWDMWFRIARQFPIDFINQPLANYRVYHYSINEIESHRQRFVSTLRFLDKVQKTLMTEYNDSSITVIKRARALTNYRYGTRLMHHKNYSQAIEIFKIAISIYPAFPKAYVRLLQSLFQQEIKLDKAEKG